MVIIYNCCHDISIIVLTIVAFWQGSNQIFYYAAVSYVAAVMNVVPLISFLQAQANEDRYEDGGDDYPESADVEESGRQYDDEAVDVEDAGDGGIVT